MPCHPTRICACARLLVLGAALLACVPTATAQTIGCLWERQADGPIGRFEAGTVEIDGQLYSFGGFFTQSIQATVRSDRYDPSTDTWTRIADLPIPVTHAAFVREGRNVWMIAGFVGDNPGVATDAVWIYDVDQDAWTLGPALPRPIAGGAACLLQREIHYFGGAEEDRIQVTGDHWVFDTNAPSLGWQPRAAMPEPRCHLAAAVLGGEVWAIGGQVGHDVAPLDTRFVHRYQPALDAWTLGPLLPRPRSHFEAATFVDSGFLYIHGGKNGTIGRDILSGTLELDPLLGEWSYLPQLPLARHGMGARRVGDYLYVIGGSGPSNFPGRDVHRRDWDAEFSNPIRINCGGDEVPMVSMAGCWCGDFGSETGVIIGYNAAGDVLGTEEDAAHDFQRRSAGASGESVSYRFPMGNGFFRVRAYFSERAFQSPGARVMDLRIENTAILEDLDVFAEVGFQTALERAYDVEVSDHVLNITLQTDPGQRAVVAALEIERLSPDHFAFECTSAPNSTGQAATIGFVGCTSVGIDNLTLIASDLPLTTFGLFIQALTPGQFPLAGGTLCVTPPFFRLPVEQASGGQLSYLLDIGARAVAAQEITPGSTWYFQSWYRDPAAPAGYGLTDALRLNFTP